MNTALPALLGAALLAALPSGSTTAIATTESSTGAPASPATPAQADGAQAFAGGLLPPVTAPIEIPDGRDIALSDLVESLADSTGLRFVVSSQTRQQLSDTPCGLLSGGTVDPDEVYPFVESVLKRHGIVMQRLSGQKVPVAALYSLNGGREVMNMGWTAVAVEDIESVRNHEALLVQCTFDVGPGDARQMTTSGRIMMRDSNYQSLFALNSSTIVLRGTGAEVAVLVDTFRLAAKAEAAALAAEAAAVQAMLEAQQRASIGGAEGGR